jgi:hypothetical protein
MTYYQLKEKYTDKIGEPIPPPYFPEFKIDFREGMWQIWFKGEWFPLFYGWIFPTIYVPEIPMVEKLQWEAIEKMLEEWREKYFIPYGFVITEWRFDQVQDLIRLMAGLSIEYRFILDLYLNLNLHLDFSQFEFNPLDFKNYFEPPVEEIPKAIYGVTCYDNSIYDPEQVTSRSVERMAWDLTYKNVDRSLFTYKHSSLSIKNYMNAMKKALTDIDVAEYFQDALELILAVVEGKVLTGSYWGVSIWDGCTWTPTGSQISIIASRNPEDWKSITPMETEAVFENWWDVSTWDYAVWDVPTHVKFDEVEEELDNRIKAFHDRVDPVWQGVFHAQKQHEFHIEGGYHLITKTDLMKRASKVLGRYDVTSIEKVPYYAFLNELKYLQYDSGKLYKTWKKILTKEALIDKYVNMGLKREILEELSKLVV